MCSARSRTGCTVILASGAAHHSRTCAAVIGPRVSWSLAIPPAPRIGGLFEVDVQHDLTLARRLGLRRSPSGSSRGVLAAGEVADRERAAHVERLGGAEQELVVGVGGDRCLEVEGVGQVEVAVHPDPAVDADLGQGDVEVPRLGGGEAFRLGGLGVEPGLGLLDQPAQLRGSDGVGERGDHGVDERRRLR